MGAVRVNYALETNGTVMTTNPEDTTPLTGAATKPVTSAWADIVGQAEKAIAEYAHTIDEIYDDALPLLNRALVATYAAASDLQKDPERLTAFLDERRPGPASAKPHTAHRTEALEGCSDPRQTASLLLVSRTCSG